MFSARARVSPFRKSGDAEPLPSSSVKSNLSAVTEHSGTGGADNNSPSENLQFISGRKSIRSLREITFKHNMRGTAAVETYRRIPVDDDYLNDSISSVNATVGSEIPNDSFRTPVVAVKGRKRTAGSSDDVELAEVDESPKKARLDLSGFFGMVASPVTMLRNRFTRVKLQCSTPNVAATTTTTAESMDVADEIVNVDAGETDEPQENVAVEGTPAVDEPKINENEVEAEKLLEKSVEIDSSNKSGGGENAEDISIATEAAEPQRSRCSIM